MVHVPCCLFLRGFVRGGLLLISMTNPATPCAHTHTHSRSHTHTLTHVCESGHMLRGSGLAVVPSLVQAYTASFWHMSKGASFDLQKVHPHYAKVAVSLCAALLSEAWRRNWGRKCRGLGGERGAEQTCRERSWKSIREVEESVLSNNYTLQSLLFFLHKWKIGWDNFTCFWFK